MCAPCVSYKARSRALAGDLKNRYVCCGGMMPCSGRCGEAAAPEVCLALEAWCCFGTSVLVTRWMLQDATGVMNTPADNCVMATTAFLLQVSCCCQILACLTSSPEIDAVADAVTLAADLVYCTVCGCMQTQHCVELDRLDEEAGGKGQWRGCHQNGRPTPGGQPGGQHAAAPRQQDMPPRPGTVGGPYGYPPPGAGYPQQAYVVQGRPVQGYVVQGRGGGGIV